MTNKEMTNKEAIDLLTEVDRIANENGEDGDGFVALKIALEALKREDHDGCDGCEHEPKDDFQFPCIICKQNFVDMYEPMPEHDSEWIPCGERLPSEKKTVLICDSGGNRCVGELILTDHGYKWKISLFTVWIDIDDGDAWMPLPEPYKGGEDE